MSQSSKLLDLLQDGQPHRTDEILESVYGGSHLGLARVGARIFDLKKKGYEIEGWKDEENPSLYWYQLIGTPEPPVRRGTASAAADSFFTQDQHGNLIPA